MSAIIDFRLGDVLRLRKPHPCGSLEWRVVRLGADIGLRCQACGRRILLERRTLEKRMKAFVSRAESAEPEIPPETQVAGPSDSGVDPSQAPGPTEQALWE